MLEGGYDLTALASSAVAHCEVLSAGYAALSKSDNEAIVEKGAQPSTPSDHSHPVRDTTANRSAEDEDCEKSYGGDEAAALAAHIASALAPLSFPPATIEAKRFRLPPVAGIVIHPPPF